jgi:hypothetical protein
LLGVLISHGTFSAPDLDLRDQRDQGLMVEHIGELVENRAAALEAVDPD